jgi:hypothetical protein
MPRTILATIRRPGSAPIVVVILALAAGVAGAWHWGWWWGMLALLLAGFILEDRIWGE